MIKGKPGDKNNSAKPGKVTGINKIFAPDQMQLEHQLEEIQPTRLACIFDVQP